MKRVVGLVVVMDGRQKPDSPPSVGIIYKTNASGSALIEVKFAPRQPRRTHHYELTPGFGSSRSVAQHDHHAFTYDPRNRVLSMPLTVYRYHRNGGNFNGVILVKVDPARGFTNLGGVEHGDLYQQTRCASSNGYCGAAANQYWNVPVTRSIFMDDNVFTLSHYGIKVNRLTGTLTPLASLIFARTNNAFLR